MKHNWIDQWVYKNSKKPAFYKEVRNPPKTIAQKLSRPQDARQIQYNSWSKARQIYSGSYLPYRAEELLNQGWKEDTAPNNKTPHNKTFSNKHKSQTVSRHARHINKHGKIEPTHYHWLNSAAIGLPKRSKRSNYYFDKYGNVCAKKSDESHIKPHRTRRIKK